MELIRSILQEVMWFILQGGFVFATTFTAWPISHTEPKSIQPLKFNSTMDQTQKLMMAQQELVNPTTTWVLFFFLGWSYGSMGKMGTQIIYYLTFGGVGIWTLYRLFTLNGAIKQYNNNVYMKYGLNEMIKN